MQVYQEEDGQVGLVLGIILDRDDLSQILGHNPLIIKFGLLSFHISFCVPSKPVSFDADGRVYFISLCYTNIWFLKGGNSLVAIHMIEDVQFMLNISLEDDPADLRSGLYGENKSYLVLKGSSLE